LAVLGIHQFLYGHPLQSGYGALSEIFSAANVRANAGHYPRWLLTTHTPAVLLALVAPFVVDRHRGNAGRDTSWLALGIVAANVACYLPYLVFEEWWYLRFLLPSIPLLVV